MAVALLAASGLAQSGKIKRIVLERTPCYGACPVYRVTLISDGTVVYEGTRFVQRLGTHRGTFLAGDLDRVAALLDGWGFWKMKPDYRARVTDQATQIVTVVTDKGRKTVREYGQSGPAELWAIQTLIDGLAASVQDWKKTRSPRPR